MTSALKEEDEAQWLLEAGDSLQSIPVQELILKFGSSTVGLTKLQSKLAREKYGLNIIPSPVNIPSWLCCLLPCLSFSKALEKYHACIPEHSLVLRDEKWLLLDCASIVPGDIVRIKRDDHVPADMRLLNNKGECIFDTSAVTGKSPPKTCSADVSSKKYFDSANMLFTGYYCIEGDCTGIVVATGMNTRISKLITKKQWPIGNA